LAASRNLADRRDDLAGPQDFGVREESIDDRTHVLAVAGELNALSAPKLGRRLMRLTTPGASRVVVVDLSAATFIDSTGLGVILDALRNLAGGGGRLALVCPTPRLLRPFEIAGLTSRLDIFSSRDDALLGLGAASS
jgi:anti-sigma B factor antagonist